MPPKTYPYGEDIPVLNLRVDHKNPRLPDVQDSQLDTLRALARDQEEKLVALAKHIAFNHLNPADRFMVMPDDEEHYIVLDGNRRISALRALESPGTVSHLLSPGADRQLKQLAKLYSENPIEDVPCVVFNDRDQAHTWIQLTHDGESGGAGRIRWSAQQRSRYQARKGKKAFHLQVLDFVAQHGAITKITKTKIDSGKYPTSTLKRVLNTPYVREKIGLEKKDGQALTQYPKSEVLKGLTKIVDDIGSERINVDDVKLQPNRFDYANTFSEDETPDRAQKGEDFTPLEEAPDSPITSDLDKAGKTRRHPHSTSRKKLIPRIVNFNIPPSRLNDIYIELQNRLVVNDVQNATAVLLRAFFEMSTDEYIDQKKISYKRQGTREDTLHKKAEEVTNYMEGNGVLTKAQLQPIRRAASRPSDPASIATLHSYVHNRRMTPGPNDLKAMWDSLQIYFEKIWE